MKSFIGYTPDSLIILILFLLNTKRKEYFHSELAFIFFPVGSTAYVRYIQVKADYPHMSTKMRGCNVASLVLGMLSALGLSMVANFQVSLDVASPNLGTKVYGIEKEKQKKKTFNLYILEAVY